MVHKTSLNLETESFPSECFHCTGTLFSLHTHNRRPLSTPKRVPTGVFQKHSGLLEIHVLCVQYASPITTFKRHVRRRRASDKTGFPKWCPEDPKPPVYALCRAAPPPPCSRRHWICGEEIIARLSEMHNNNFVLPQPQMGFAL